MYIDNSISNVQQYLAMYINNPSYYRANPFAEQGFLPNSAFKNRKPTQFVGELPQGQHFFDPIGKKHYQHSSHRSQISQSDIMSRSNAERVLSRDYFRSLNVNDIEGASTNTLISKAIKNKLKAQEALREQRERETSNHMLLSQAHQHQRNRIQALDQFRKDMATRKDMKNIEPKINTKDMEQRINIRDIEQRINGKNVEPRKTAPQPNSSQFQQQQEHKNNIDKQSYMQQQRSQQYYDQAQNIYFKQKEEMLQRQLQQNNYHQVKKNKGEESKKKLQLRQLEQREKQLVRNEYLSKQIQQKRREELPVYKNQYKKQQRQQTPIYLNQYDKIEEAAQKKMYQQNKIKYNSYDMSQNIHRKTPPPTKSYPLEDRRIREQKTNQQKISNVEQKNINEIQKNDQRNTPNYIPRLITPYEQRRLYNPTFLSYGSPTIGFAGRNIVGN